MRGILAQLNVSGGGMPKRSVSSAHVAPEGVAGDWSKNRKHHGGPDRAVCLYSVELYDWLADQGIRLPWGSLGENFTTRGLDLGLLRPGARLRVGACALEITKVRVPCRSLDQWDLRLKKLIDGRSGWMAKVLEDGIVKPGDAIEVLECPAIF